MKLEFTEKKALYVVWFGIIIIAIAGLLFFIKGSWNYGVNKSIDESKIAAYGDFIAGTVGTLFSLAGIILFYIALRDQRKDFHTNQQAFNKQIESFEQQVKEFELQRKELAETRKVYEEQSKTLKSQRFEDTFYSFMNVFIERRKSLALGDYNEFFKNISAKLHIENLEPGFIGLEQIKKEYEHVYIECRSQIASYFIIFYRLLKMIELSGVDDKDTYHKILRSIVSKDELLVLYYNYHSRFGQKPIPIALKYEYFKHLEKLSKIELKILLKNSDPIFALNNLVDTLSESVISCIRKAKSLDEGDVVVEFQIMSGVFARIEVSDELRVDFITDSDKELIFERTREDFLLLFENLLVDVIYSSYFSSFESRNLLRVTIDDRNQKIESFRFQNINHIS